jgi:hypothetical protein
VRRSSRHIRRIACAAVVATAALVPALNAPAQTTVPELEILSASPSRFCVKQSSTCGQTGTTVRFKLSRAAFVRGNVWPRFRNAAGYRVLRRQFNAGTNTFRLSDARMTPGRWTLKLQGRNNVGSGTTDNIDVRVVK